MDFYAVVYLENCWTDSDQIFCIGIRSPETMTASVP
jgi:hypothetical protein